MVSFQVQHNYYVMTMHGIMSAKEQEIQHHALVTGIAVKMCAMSF